MTGRVAASTPPPPSNENNDSCTRRGVCVQSVLWLCCVKYTYQILLAGERNSIY
jgi:hypothetical protein